MASADLDFGELDRCRPSGRASRAASCDRTTSKVWATSARADVIDMDRGARQRRRLPACPAKRASRAGRRRLGSEQHLPLSQDGRDRRDLQAPGRSASATVWSREGAWSASIPATHFLIRRRGTEGYDALVSTMPLDRLVEQLVKLPGRPAPSRGGARAHRASAWSGSGTSGRCETDRCWMYFPETGRPFYRVTNFAKYAAANVPGGDTSASRSYLTETLVLRASTRERPRRHEAARARRPRRDRARRGDTPIASVCTIDVDYAYPVPTLGRDGALAVVQPWLFEHDILLAGTLRLLALRDRQHGPRREDGDRRRPPSPGRVAEEIVSV